MITIGIDKLQRMAQTTPLKRAATVSISFTPVDVETDSEGCGLLLSRIARAVNRSLARSLGELGLRSQQFAIIHRLADSGPASQAELAGALRVHASNLVRVLDELEAAGLIGRRRDPLDRRRQLIGVTAAGARLLGRAEQIAADTERDLLVPLSAAERAQLRRLLAKLAGHSCASSATSATSPRGRCAE